MLIFRITHIIKEDLSSLLTSAISHPSQRYVQAVAASSEGSWPKVWDVLGTICSLAVLRLLSLHTFSDKKCPVPDCTHVVETTESPCVHFLAAHTNLEITVDDCVNSCVNCTEDVFVYGQTLQFSDVKLPQFFRNFSPHNIRGTSRRAVW